MTPTPKMKGVTAGLYVGFIIFLACNVLYKWRLVQSLTPPCGGW